jgi:hypothetical protein
MSKHPPPNRDSEDQERDFGDEAPGDTVRILPDAADHDSLVRRGSLYAHQPASQSPSRRHYEAYEPQPAAPTSPRPRKQARATIQEPEPAPAQQAPVVVRQGPSACAIMAATFSILALAFVVLAFVALQGGMASLGKLAGINPFSGFTIVTTPTVTIDTSRPAVIDRVRALARLESVHYQMEKVVSAKSSGPLPDFLTSDRILLVAHGEVVGGIDLSKIEPDDITVISDSVTIRLPAPEILYSKLDNDKTYVYDRQTGVFSKPNPNLETQVRQTAEQQIVQAAMEDGILEKARDNAEQVLRTLVTGLGYKDVRFEEGP